MSRPFYRSAVRRFCLLMKPSNSLVWPFALKTVWRHFGTRRYTKTVCCTSFTLSTKARAPHWTPCLLQHNTICLTRPVLSVSVESRCTFKCAATHTEVTAITAICAYLSQIRYIPLMPCLNISRKKAAFQAEIKVCACIHSTEECHASVIQWTHGRSVTSLAAGARQPSYPVSSLSWHTFYTLPLTPVFVWQSLLSGFPMSSCTPHVPRVSSQQVYRRHRASGPEAASQAGFFLF